MYNIHRRMKISKCYSQILVKKMKKAGFPPQKHRFPYGITVFDTKKGVPENAPLSSLRTRIAGVAIRFPSNRGRIPTPACALARNDGR